MTTVFFQFRWWTRGDLDGFRFPYLCRSDGWFRVAGLFSSIGMIHGCHVTPAAIVNACGPETTWPFVTGYLVMGGCFLFPGRKGDNV